MEEFNGMSRDTIRVKTPAGMWEFARNILLTKGFNSISNEYGFKPLNELVGDIIGCISTNEELVIFSIEDNYSCIGVVNLTTNIYTLKLRTIYLNFKKNRPIEGIFLYNFNKELIIAFCDGVFIDSNTPKLINLSNIGIPLTPSYELVNPTDINQLNLFPTTTEGIIDISYGNTISIAVDIVYITFAYVLADGISTTSYYSPHNISYPVYNWKGEKRRIINLTLSNLDPNFSKLKIGLVVNNNGGLLGYESPALDYSNQTLQTSITSLTGYTELAVDNLVVPSIVYSKIKSITTQNNQVVVGNVETIQDLNLQKYVNLLEVGLTYVTDIEDTYTHPTLSPDEVYAIYIQPQSVTGEYLSAYPLIGRAARVGERDVLDSTALENLGLKRGASGIAANTYRRFHIENSGAFVLPAPYDINNPAHNELDWGYWENTETYPLDANFDSTKDYNNLPLSSVDLRGTPIRYFRVPGLDAITDKIPCILGYKEKNDSSIYGNSGNKFIGRVPKFGVYIKNFDSIFPESIKAVLQGFRLLIVKRQTGDRLVEDIPFIKQAKEMIMFHTDANIEVPTIMPIFKFTPVASSPENLPMTEYYSRQYGLSKIWSSTLLNYKPNIQPQIVKANYGVKHKRYIEDFDGSVSFDIDKNLGFIDYNEVNNLELAQFYKVPNTQKYALIQDLKYLPQNNISAKTSFSEESIIMEVVNYNEVGVADPNKKWNPFLVGSTSNISTYNSTTKLYENISRDSYGFHITLSVTLLNLQLNVYAGFAPTEFISLGKVSIDNTTRVLKYNGDVFTNNSYNSILTTDLYSGVSNYIQSIHFTPLIIKGIWSIANNNTIKSIEDKNLNNAFYNTTAQYDTLLAFNYSYAIYNKEAFRSLNDLIVVTAFNVNNKKINYFPFRVARTPNIPKENLQTNILRTFKANDYYEMLNNRGEVVAVRGTNRQLYIQQRYSLFLAYVKDKLSISEDTTYLGEGDLFDRTPEEIKFNTDKGYIGCSNQIACVIIPDGLVVLDQEKGNIFIIGNSLQEISKFNMRTWFQANLTTIPYYTTDRFGNRQPVDNPYTSIGYIISYDEEFNRIIITKKYYKFLFENEVGTVYGFNGEYYYNISTPQILLSFKDSSYFKEESLSISYSLDYNKWVCEHDYFPNLSVFNNKGLYSFYKNSINSFKLYKNNDKTINRGSYYDGVYASYVDLIFNNRLDLSKLYQAVEWESVVKTIEGATLYNKTIDKIMIYSDYQCSGEIHITAIKNARNIEGVWNFNEFRDIVVDPSLPIVDKEGRLNLNNINNNKSYFEKSVFIGTFVVIRLITSNGSTNDVYINYVNIKSRVSNR